MIIRLDEQTECSVLCKLIQKEINRYEKENGSASNKALLIKVVDIEESTAHIPKLEHNYENNNRNRGMGE